jgi:monofunctional biosynthetic peptidoglycan transglycosylase
MRGSTTHLSEDESTRLLIMVKKRNSKWLFSIFFVASLLLFLYLLSMPKVSKLKKEYPKKTALMEYREKESQEKRKKFEVHQIRIPLSRISPYLIKAVLIAEDDKFWGHEGFDYEAIQKAIEKDIKAGRLRYGGSTISQQLARNLYLSPQKNLFRKVREAIITWRMEETLSKKRILELYLNVVEWGDGIFGAEAASRNYFGKPCSELTPEESARLAAVLPNPRKYSPAGNQQYVTHRADLIYSIMIRRGIVVPEYEEAAEGSNL